MTDDGKEARGFDCEVPQHTVPPEELGRYSPKRDPHSEADIAQYIEIEARGESVKHVEKVKEEVVAGEVYEVWDVITDRDRWWVITNMTNLYSQRHFPSLDYTISFHIGLMMRMSSRPRGADSDAPTPFDDVFRRREQAEYRLEAAVEPEDYQAVGMQLRECLISLVGALRRRVKLAVATERPQDANFIAWSALLIDEVCPGSPNKELRQYLKGTAKDTWQLVNWLTHDRNASGTAAGIAVHGCDTLIGHFLSVFELERVDRTEQCPLCKSRQVRQHFDPATGVDGDYFTSCGKCGWNNHPGGSDNEQNDDEQQELEF